MKNDADYRQDQKNAQEDWKNNNPDYWKNYRIDHEQYTDRNRDQQRRRNLNKRTKSAPANKSEPIAKMDVWTFESSPGNHWAMMRLSAFWSFYVFPISVVRLGFCISRAVKKK